MKIDLHCHTKRCKSGDSIKRNVDKLTFAKVLEENEVKIAAITNHNCFDLEQYNSFRNIVEKAGIQVWPGVEFDICFNNETGHVLFITNPRHADNFSSLVNELVGKVNLDDVCLPFEDVISKFSDLETITIAHYNLLKNHGFSDDACKEMSSMVKNKIFLLEPSNIRSVGIMYANDMDSFIGSDVSDWGHYPARNVPELKMPIDGFESFMLLLKKDHKVIKTFIDQKEEVDYEIQPFLDEEKADETTINIPLRRDVNVIFGGKGTGKTKILKALKKKAAIDFGEAKVSYYEGQTKDEKYNELIKRPFNSSYFDCLGTSADEDKFKSIKEWTSNSPVVTKKFYKGFVSLQNESNFTKFGFSKASFSGVLDASKMQSMEASYKNLRDATDKIKAENLDLYLPNSDKTELLLCLDKLILSAKWKYKDAICDYYSLELQKFTIENMKLIAQAKTGKDSLPAATGFADFFMNCLIPYQAADLLYKKISTTNKTIKDKIGEIPGKGMVFVETNIYLNPNAATGLVYDQSKNKSRLLKKCLNDLNEIKRNAFSKQLSKEIETFNSDCDDKVKSLKDFMGIKSDEKIEWENGKIERYESSSGERSMLLLSHALIDDNKEAYFLDEPEISVGHKYVNEVIVPRLKYLAKLNKLIVISTHDANIAVRTFPLESIYREYGKTYVGNLFIDKLILTTDESSTLNWTETSMNYLEGGEFAFKERKQSYGF